MDILVELPTVTLSNFKKVNNVSDITKNHRLFYELGFNKTIRKWRDKDGNICTDSVFIRTGKFKEIENIDLFIKTDKRLSDKEFIEHHNFVIAPITSVNSDVTKELNKLIK